MNVNEKFKHITKETLESGLRYPNKRRGVDRLQIPSYTFRHDVINDGFPLLGLKKTNYKRIITELIWFLRGDNDIKYLVDNGNNIWNKDAYNWYKKTNKTPIDFEDFCKKGVGSVGRNYSIQWRDYNGKKDQIKDLISGMKNDIMCSRLIVNAWNPSELNETALPPCHTFFQVVGVPNKGFELHWNQRSVDLFLGLPFNIASYASLGYILQEITGHKFLALQGDLKCIHFYENAIDEAYELLSMPIPKNCSINLKDITDDFEKINHDNFEIVDYEHNKFFKVEMIAPKEI